MPRYFFDVRDGFSVRDELGTEFADIYAAQNEAIRYSGELLQEVGARFWNETEWVMEVCDEHRAILFVLRFSAEERGLQAPLEPDAEQS